MTTVFKLGDHDAILFNFDDAPPTTISEESDSYYELSVNEAKKLYQEYVKQVQDLEEKPLMTQKLRDFEHDKSLLYAMNRHPVTQLRICFPDRNVIQANFKPRNTIKEVMSFIRPFLVKPDMQFCLYSTFPKQILDPELSLVEAKCIPRARLYFECNEACSVFLSAETLLKKSSFEGATKEIITSRSSVSSFGDENSLSSNQSSLLQNHSEDKKRSQGTTNIKPKWFKMGK